VRLASSTVLIHLLILLIGGRRQFHFISKCLLRCLGLVLLRICSQLAIILEYFVTVKDFVDDLIVGSWVLEERIVHVTTTGWVNSDEVTSSLILKHSLLKVFFVLQIGCLFHRLEEWRVFDWVVLDKSLDVLLKLVA
jgi:hypothetical protein